MIKIEAVVSEKEFPLAKLITLNWNVSLIKDSVPYKWKCSRNLRRQTKFCIYIAVMQLEKAW